MGPNDGKEEKHPRTEATSCKEVQFLINGEDSSIFAINFCH